MDRPPWGLDEPARVNEKVGDFEYKPVVQNFIRTADKIYQLTYEDGTLIETTWSHPFYIKGKGWVKAEDLVEGDVSQTEGNGSLKIAKIHVDVRGEEVYNFEVEEDHNYYVSEAGVLVHNEGYPRIPEPDKGGALRQHRLQRLMDTPEVSLEGSRSYEIRDESDEGIFVDTNRKIIVMKDADGTPIYENTIESEEWFGFIDTEQTLNGDAIIDGGIIKTDFRTGIMSITSADEVQGRSIFVSTTGVMNEPYENAERSVELMEGAMRAGYKETYHIVNDDGTFGDRGMDAPARTLQTLMENGHFDDGGAIVAHSQGTAIVAKALENYRGYNRAHVYAYGGAHGSSQWQFGMSPDRPIRADRVAGWHDFFNDDDGWTYNESFSQKDGRKIRKGAPIYHRDSKVTESINRDQSNWGGEGHDFGSRDQKGGYFDAYEKCFPNWWKCQ